MAADAGPDRYRRATMKDEARAASSGRDIAEGLARALAGALLLSLPLLMTMEMWWLGFYMDPWRMCILLIVFFPLLTGLSHFVGFDESGNIRHAALHALIAYGVGAVAAAGLLTIFAVLTPTMGAHELVGKIGLQMVGAALGALLAQAHFGSPPEEERRRADATYLAHLFFIVVGALYVALALAPTEEMVVIGQKMTDMHAVAAVFASIAVLHMFVMGVGFPRHPASEERDRSLHPFFRLTLVGYLLALSVSGFLLWVFGRFDAISWAEALHGTVVLGLPATLGGAAARLTLDTK
jgi:putative integral membrane protein (TIGR02587 family)